MACKSLLVLAAAQAVSAHFGLVYPEWRADTLADEDTSKYSQWSYPCAGVEYGAGNITDWPLDGGSLKLDLHHPWGYLFVNLGLGNDSSNFNISLTPQLWNATGKGTLCIDKLPVPVDIADGTLATLQIVTSGESGNALYNCADIRFSKDAKALDNCTSSDGLTVTKVKDQSGNSTSDEAAGSSNGTDSKGNDTESADGSDDEGAAGVFRVDKVALATVAGLATAFALGLGF